MHEWKEKWFEYESWCMVCSLFPLVCLLTLSLLRSQLCPSFSSKRSLWKRVISPPFRNSQWVKDTCSLLSSLSSSSQCDFGSLMPILPSSMSVQLEIKLCYANLHILLVNHRNCYLFCCLLIIITKQNLLFNPLKYFFFVTHSNFTNMLFFSSFLIYYH